MAGVLNSNMVAFCRGRLEGQTVNSIIKNFREGVQTENLEQHLKDGDYIPVLSAVWGERDKKRRIEWLRSHADLHAPLMFELAIAEFIAAPSIETIREVVSPLIHAATFRVHQDACCSTDPSVSHGNAPISMKKIYQEALRRAAEKYAPSLVDAVCADDRDAAMQKMFAIAIRTMEKPTTLPNPTWIASQGIAPSDQFTQLRQNVVQQELLPFLNSMARINELLAQN